MKRLILSVIALAVSASPLAAKVGFLEPKPSNKNGIYYHSDIISLEEGEKFEVLLAEGRSSQDFALYIYKHDSDPSSEPISDNAESYLSHRTTESLKGETLYGPLKIFNVSAADPDPLTTRRLYRPIVQYRISAVEDLSLAALASGVENNTKGIETNATTIQGNGTGIAANVSSIATNSTTIADHELDILQNRGIGLETANDIARNSTTIADHEERITQNRGIGLETAADIAVNSTSIQANARDIATNGSSIQDIATSVTTVATSVQDNATAIVANGTGIQDIATTIEKIGTSVQDNATSIATNGAAIAGNRTSTQEIAAGVAENGTSIQGVATGIETIAKNVQDNATGVAANASSIAASATSIAGNTTSIQDNTTGVAANVMLIAGNLSKIQLINQNIEGINRDLDLGKNERGRNVLEIGKNQLRFQALENQIDSLGSDAAFIQKLGDEFATKDDLTTAISEGKTQGINAVTSDPNNWNIFTADQIQEMAVGDLVLTREENGDFVLNYEIQQSDNAKDWTTYSAQAETITGLPVNKAFVRIRTR
ncbi:hypothetical protein OAF68_10470 [Akkermansiaceae bacterium]|nr:hypothetical protein [Akkermansiaceae bacterium]